MSNRGNVATRKAVRQAHGRQAAGPIGPATAPRVPDDAPIRRWSEGTRHIISGDEAVCLRDGITLPELRASRKRILAKDA